MDHAPPIQKEAGEWVNRSADFENSFAGISDSKGDFNRFPDPANCSRLWIHLLFGPGFWTLRVIKILLPGFQIQGENGRADLCTPIHPPPERHQT